VSAQEEVPLSLDTGAVGREPARRQVVEGHPVLEVADRVLDLGVAAMIGLEHEGLTIAVGDEGVIVVQREQGELAARGRLHPADDEPDRGRTLLVGERDVRRLGHVGATGDPVRDRAPGVVGDGLDQPSGGRALADRDAEADTCIARQTATTAWP